VYLTSMPSWNGETLRFSRRALPHWEIRDGRYFVTVRCARSLPASVTLRLQSVHEELQRIDPQSHPFANLQRRYFQTVEKYLDSEPSGPLAEPVAARAVIEQLDALSQVSAEVPCYSIMPNHWHAIIVPRDSSWALGALMKRIKGRSARSINCARRTSGSVWQREWFDHWIRDAAEWDRCVDYIRNNPVKAGLVKKASDHPWTK
jgi:putative transposase